MKKALTLAVGCVVIFGARSAHAQVGQAWTDRGYVNVNVGFEAGSSDLNDTSTFRLYDEDATLSVAQPTDSGAFFDFSVGTRLWHNVSAGIGYHQGKTKSTAAIAGSIPHPLFFNRARTISESVADLERLERAFHLQFGYMIPVTRQTSVHVTAGPSFFRLRQDVVSQIGVTEQGGDFSRVTVNPVLAERTDHPVGFNIGADITYLFTSGGATRDGVGAFIRYAGASSDVQVLQNTVSSDVGGLQVG
ncbi:MAG TPA: hypothetical protein VEK56_14165, partial [Vicinamibacterales bacterium]|nr:hypothetical protein [Vicinamibacterales bacterium]